MVSNFKSLMGAMLMLGPLLVLGGKLPNISNPIYIITNGETPSLSRRGLSPIGNQRATECLPQLFSTLDVGKIIMCPQNDDSEVCFETLDTTQPIANALDLPIDTTCGADENTDDNCVTKLMENFAKTSSQSILVVWDLQEVTALLEEDLSLDTDNADAVDKVHFDVLTIVNKKKITTVTSQNCTDIDGVAPGTGLQNGKKKTTRGDEKLKRKRRSKEEKRNLWMID